eukprot:1649911-Ditylum_brightwellii.AAC.1
MIVALCDGSPCAYKLKEGSGVADVWISKYDCPSIRRVYGKGITTLLGKAVLWEIFESNHKHLVPQAWRHLVVAHYNKIPSHHHLSDGENPVVKRHLVVREYDGSPHFDTI